jgi:hypothetical protein
MTLSSKLCPPLWRVFPLTLLFVVESAMRAGSLGLISFLWPPIVPSLQRGHTRLFDSPIHVHNFDFPSFALRRGHEHRSKHAHDSQT